MAHLILQLGTIPLIPFRSRRVHVSRRLRMRALWEAAMAAPRDRTEQPLIDPRLLPVRMSVRDRHRPAGGNR